MLRDRSGDEGPLTADSCPPHSFRQRLPPTDCRPPPELRRFSLGCGLLPASTAAGSCRRECLVYTRSFILAGAVALAALACRDEPTAPTETTSRAESASRPVEGWFHLLRVDPAPGYGPATVQYELVDRQGHGTALDLD